MVVILKIIHFLALAVVVGGGVTGGVIGARMGKADANLRPVLASIQTTIGKLGLGALVLLWLTGILLTYMYYGGWENLPSSFWLKIIFVVILTGLSVRMNMQSRANEPRERLPNRGRALIGQMAVVSSFLIVIFAALAFTH